MFFFFDYSRSFGFVVPSIPFYVSQSITLLYYVLLRLLNLGTLQPWSALYLVSFLWPCMSWFSVLHTCLFQHIIWLLSMLIFYVHRKKYSILCFVLFHSHPYFSLGQQLFIKYDIFEIMCTYFLFYFFFCHKNIIIVVIRIGTQLKVFHFCDLGL